MPLQLEQRLLAGQSVTIFCLATAPLTPLFRMARPEPTMRLTLTYEYYGKVLDDFVPNVPKVILPTIATSTQAGVVPPAPDDKGTWYVDWEFPFESKVTGKVGGYTFVLWQSRSSSSADARDVYAGGDVCGTRRLQSRLVLFASQDGVPLRECTSTRLRRPDGRSEHPGSSCSSSETLPMHPCLRGEGRSEHSGSSAAGRGDIGGLLSAPACRSQGSVSKRST